MARSEQLEPLLSEQQALPAHTDRDSSGASAKPAQKLTVRRILSTLFSLNTCSRLLSSEMWDICLCLYVLVRFKLPPVAYSRSKDIVTGMRTLPWTSNILSEPLLFLAAFLGIFLDALGASFIKLAQVVAHSPMVAPEALVRNCKASLAQCTAPVVPFAEVASAVCAELGAPNIEAVFESFESKPMASASIAQVHAATLPGGRRVVVKLVRPGVKDRLEFDLTIVWLVRTLCS